MTTLTDTTAQDGVSQALYAAYPRITDDQVLTIIRLLENQDADTVVKGLDRHILSEDGQWPPSAGQIMAHVREMDREAQQKRQQEAQKPLSGPRKVVQVPDHIRSFVGAKNGENRTVEVFPSPCPHCCGRGLARFYHSIDNGPRRVWLAPDALNLPESTLARTRVSYAICDCEDGQNHPQAHLHVARFPSDPEHTVPAWPHLSQIRKMAARNDIDSVRPRYHD